MISQGSEGWAMSDERRHHLLGIRARGEMLPEAVDLVLIVDDRIADAIGAREAVEVVLQLGEQEPARLEGLLGHQVLELLIADDDLARPDGTPDPYGSVAHSLEAEARGVIRIPAAERDGAPGELLVVRHCAFFRSSCRARKGTVEQFELISIIT